VSDFIDMINSGGAGTYVYIHPLTGWTTGHTITASNVIIRNAANGYGWDLGSNAWTCGMSSGVGLTVTGNDVKLEGVTFKTSSVDSSVTFVQLGSGLEWTNAFACALKDCFMQVPNRGTGIYVYGAPMCVIEHTNFNTPTSGTQGDCYAIRINGGNELNIESCYTLDRTDHRLLYSIYIQKGAGIYLTDTKIQSLYLDPSENFAIHDIFLTGCIMDAPSRAPCLGTSGAYQITHILCGNCWFTNVYTWNTNNAIQLNNVVASTFSGGHCYSYPSYLCFNGIGGTSSVAVTGMCISGTNGGSGITYTGNV